VGIRDVKTNERTNKREACDQLRREEEEVEEEEEEEERAPDVEDVVVVVVRRRLNVVALPAVGQIPGGDEREESEAAEGEEDQAPHPISGTLQHHQAWPCAATTTHALSISLTRTNTHTRTFSLSLSLSLAHTSNISRPSSPLFE